MFGQPTYGQRVYGSGAAAGIGQAIQVFLHKAYFTLYISFKKIFKIRI